MVYSIALIKSLYLSLTSPRSLSLFLSFQSIKTEKSRRLHFLEGKQWRHKEEEEEGK